METMFVWGIVIVCAAVFVRAFNREYVRPSRARKVGGI